MTPAEKTRILAVLRAAKELAEAGRAREALANLRVALIATEELRAKVAEAGS